MQGKYGEKIFIYNDNKNIEKQKWKYKPEYTKWRFKPIQSQHNTKASLKYLYYVENTQ